MFSRLRNVHSSERSGQNALNTSDAKPETRFVRKKFFRHHKKHSTEEHTEKKFEIPEHEFEERFEVKPPPKVNVNVTETQQFSDWFFRDDMEDLEASDSSFYNATEVSSV